MIHVVVFILNLYFALVLLTSGLSKLASPDYALFNAIKLHNELIPLGQVLYQTLAWVEIGVSVLFVTNTSIRLATIANIVLFVLFLALNIIVFSIAKDTNCGCFGNIYKVKNDKIHIIATTAQVILSFAYYRLTTAYGEVLNIQTITSLILFSGLCIWILARRLSQATNKGLTVNRSNL